jgi:hypothetical protein
MDTRTSAGYSTTATWRPYVPATISATGLPTPRLPALLIALFSLASFACPIAAQDLTEDEFEALSSPSAIQREVAAAKLGKDKLLTYYRKLLDDGGGAVRVVAALERVQAEKSPDDIGRIVKYIGDLDPGVAEAAMGALRTYGRDALKAVENLAASQVDSATRKQVIERLLKDHIYKCCQRDLGINPFYLEYEGRFDELNSVSQDIDELMFRMLRDAIGDVRDDIAGTRYYYYWNYQSAERPFIDYGGLAVAALARKHPERLLRETTELTQVESNDDWWWGYSNRAPVTIELANFFARNGNTAVMDKIITDLENNSRWMQGPQMLGLHLRIAAMQMNALGEHEAALDRLNEHLKQTGSALSSTVSQAHYLRARILMHLKEDGAALHALEESMEASDTAMVLTLVDSTFAALAGERRFQTVLNYCQLVSRRLDESQRPWQPTAEK